MASLIAACASAIYATPHRTAADFTRAGLSRGLSGDSGNGVTHVASTIEFAQIAHMAPAADLPYFVFSRREGRQFRQYLRSRPGGYWAAWAPNLQQIEPGAIGRFDRDARFHAANQANLAARGITAKISAEMPIGDQLYYSRQDWDLAGGFRGKLPIGSQSPLTINADGKMTLKAKNYGAWLLQVRAATKAYIENDVEVFEQIRQILLDGASGANRWRVDNYVVTERVRASEGFALLCHLRGREVTLELGAGAALGEKELACAKLDATLNGQSSSLMIFRFDDKRAGSIIPTPIFGAPIGIKREHWAKLLLLQRRDYELIDAAGESWQLGDWTPANLDHLPEEARYYQQGAPGTLTPEEIEAMPLGDLFGPIDHIDDDPFKSLRLLRRGLDGLVSRIRRSRDQPAQRPVERA